MDKKIEVGLMLDYYGQLLTERQEEIVDLYYNNDLSMGEIAQSLGITRQGVYDNLKRSEKALYNIENKLGLVKRFLDEKDKIKFALELAKEIENEIKDKEMESTYNKLKEVSKILKLIVDH